MAAQGQGTQEITPKSQQVKRSASQGMARGDAVRPDTILGRHSIIGSAEIAPGQTGGIKWLRRENVRRRSAVGTVTLESACA